MFDEYEDETKYGDIATQNYKRIRKELENISLSEEDKDFLRWLSEWTPKDTDVFLRIISKVRGASFKRGATEHGKDKEE